MGGLGRKQRQSSKSEAKLTKPAQLRAGHNTASFDCGEEVMGLWLTKRALPAYAERTANTFVVCRGKRVVAYYSLATASISHEDCTSSLRRNTPNPVPALILARLAVDQREKGNGIGRHLLQDAMQRSLRVATKFAAARTLLVHALNPEVAAYYRKMGFVDLPLPKDGQITLHLTLDKIAAALKAQGNMSN